MLKVRFHMEIFYAEKTQPGGSTKQVRERRKCTMAIEGWKSIEEGNRTAVTLQKYLQNCGYDIKSESSKGTFLLIVKVASARRGFELYDKLQHWGNKEQIGIE